MSVLPTAIMALLGVGTVVYVLVTSAVPVPMTMRIVLVVAVAAAAIVMFAAAARAGSVARAVQRRVGALRSSTARSQAEMQRLLEQLHNGERPALRGPDFPPIDAGDVFALLENDLNQAQVAAQAAVLHAATLTPAGKSGQQVEVFVNLARRLQSLVHREIQLLDELENEVEDPDLLKGLFFVDHLATRMRRHAENLAVLGGAVSRRQWSRPVAVTEVLRSAIAEVEQYSRVKLVPPIEGTLRGHAVADVIHLIAELVENATNFSPPHTQVLLRAQNVTAGLAVEVEDRGLGMSFTDQDRVNNLLADPDRIDIDELLRDGRIGLFVVSALGRRHGIAVRLQSNIYGGTQAVIVLPHGLLGTSPQEHEARQQPVQQVMQQQVMQAPPQQQMIPAARPQPMPALAAQASAAIPAERPSTGFGHTTHEGPSTGFGHTNGPAQPIRPVLRETTPGPAASAPIVGTGDAPASTANHTIRPTLPQRHRQQHLAPQLHQPPTARPDEPVAGHDPNLMAAFMRGVSLAESGADDEDGLRGRTDSIS